MVSITDALGEWWISPLATTLPGQGRTVFGAIASDGAILACQIDHDTDQTLRIPIAQAPVDDHNVPSLWAAPGRRMVATWTHHSQQRFIHCKVSDPGGDITTLADADNQPTPDQASTCSYTQIHHLPHASTDEVDSFLVFSRIQATSWSVIPFTVDQETGHVDWGETVQFMGSVGQSYLSTAGDRDPEGGRHTIRVAWGYNPAQPTSAVRYVEVDTLTGHVTSPADPNVEANIHTGAGLPLVDTDIAPLIPEPGAAFSRRLFYVRPGPASPGVAYADWTRTDPDNAEYKVISRQDDGGWAVQSYGTAGPRIGFTAAANYIPGMAFPDPCLGDEVYLARATTEGGTVERHTGSEGVAATEVLASTPDTWARPVPPIDGAGTLAFLIHRYEDGFRDYLADAHYLTDPITPPQLFTVDRAIRIHAGDLRTGRLITELTPSAASWSVAHRTAGTINTTVPIGAMTPGQVGALLAATEGARCFLAVVCGDDVLEAGPIWTHDYAPAGNLLTIVAKGLWSLWDHRIVMGALTPTPAAPNPWRGWDVTYQDLSLGTIAKRLVELAMSHTGGQLPVVLPADESGIHERTYYGYELGVVGERLTQLMEVINGPDIAFEPRFNTDRTGITWHMRTGDPILSQDGEDWVWDTTPARSAVQEGTIRRDWSNLASAAWAVNNALEHSRLMRRVIDTRLTDGGFPLLETTEAYGTVRRGTTLDSHAAADLDAASAPWLSLNISVRAEETPLLGSYRPGDYAQVHLPDDPYLGGLGLAGRAHRSRILQVQGDLTETVRLTMAPVQEER